MWVDCNCGRRNTACDSCPSCGAGAELNYNAAVLVAAEQRCFEIYGAQWGSVEFFQQCEELAPIFRKSA